MKNLVRVWTVRTIAKNMRTQLKKSLKCANDSEGSYAKRDDSSTIVPYRTMSLPSGFARDLSGLSPKLSKNVPTANIAVHGRKAIEG